MKKTLFLLLISTTFILVGCNNDKSNSNSQTSNIIKTDNSNSYNESSSFLISPDTLYPTQFISSTNSLIFPNWDDNNKISIINDPIPQSIITSKDIVKFFNYSTHTLAIQGDIIYFADASNNNSLSSINMIDGTYKKLNSHNVSNLLLTGNNLLYINKTDGKLYSYDTINKTSKIIINNVVGKYLLNGNYILYENKSDSSKLYKINLDGTEDGQVTTFSVNSFATYNNYIVAINSDDNNNLYKIDPETLRATRIALINGEDLKTFKNTLYFINTEKNNHLYSLDINDSSNQVSLSPIINQGINEYYPSEKGFFVQIRSNVNNTYIFKTN